MADALRIETGWPPKALQPNARSHWRTKHNATKAAKREAFWATYQQATPGRFGTAGRFNVRITAHPAVGRVRDKDNLVAASKNFLDGIAAALGVNDSQFEAPTVEWAERRPGGRLIFEIEPKQ
jgi:crossover junction endodeoxyribonuclease RusA